MADREVDLSGALLEQRYRVDALLARGGMSSVYRGLDTRLDRPVAIKVMDPRFAADRTFVDRFELEARSAAKIHHPNVVAVHDQGLDGDHVFLVMELVAGGTLRDLLDERGALDVPLAISIMEPMLAALAAAHQAGLVHRDVKPENVLIGANGAVKVGDFGLVRAIAGVRTTSSSVILGTVAYLSPEQVTTGTATARGDVYSAGVVLYEMLTGAPPYVGDNPLSIAYRHVNDDVPAPGTGLAALDELVLRATRRDPAGRPGDAGAFLIDLERVRAAAPVPRVPVPAPRHHQVDLTVPVSAEDRVRALGLDLPAPVDLWRDPAAAATLVPVSTATVVRPAPGFQAMGPRGTRAMLRTDLPPAMPPAPPSPPYGTPPPPSPLPVPAAPRPPRQPMNRQKRTLLLSLIGVLVLALVGTGTWWFTAGRWASVPAVAGQDETSAKRALAEAGVDPQVVPTPDDTVEAGKVIRTEPGDGANVLRGDPVRLLVSSGLPQVPEVEPGVSVEEASAAIRGALLSPQPDDGRAEFSDTVPAGAVVRLSPDPGTRLNTRAVVTIITSRGPAPKPVPDVRGKTRDEAFQVLTEAGFEPFDDKPEFSRDVDGKQVVKTKPGAGTELKPTDSRRIGVVLSSAVTVPNVTDGNVAQAKQKLEALGLQLDVRFGSGNADSRVFAQVPTEGGRVEPGARVLIWSLP
ncbi:Stk1 family PASTA domain-containing Ser/Thr kinase [Actinophytocola sp.]|uniref:Stk1 family PASTA domain-containing Ser/Thr kinase n=1 Tax=Actinophytocola sp. TaxID=1872138 RepID=UPI002D7E696F|nr:PASTA domain-containing protein [Actinophytocola sp.]HET9141851.1 PASTA domain-containing protein [Actinophytocola sp.]